MAKEIFRFKRFEVRHFHSSMRVGTDAVLLGAWTSLGRCAWDAGARILDIGCGCGVVALMVAQRSCSDHVLGMDIDAPSVEEARVNAGVSPFASRVHFFQADIRAFAAGGAGDAVFSLIVCNPPYYTEDTLPPDARRSVARNASHLGFAELLDAVCRLLDNDGIFSVVIPMQARETFVSEAMAHGLFLGRECRVSTVAGKAPKRVLMEFARRQCGRVDVDTLVLQDAGGGRTAGYANLCADFYLW